MTRYRRSPMCSYCYESGHTKRGCPTLKKEIAEGSEYAQRHAPKPRLCGYCKEPGHTRRKCDDLHSDKIDAILKNRRWSQLIVEDLKKCGVGAGTVFEIKEGTADTIYGLVTGFYIPHKLCYKKPSFGFIKVRFFMGSVENPSYSWNFHGHYRNTEALKEHIIRIGDVYRVNDQGVAWDKITLRGSMADSETFKVLVRMDNQPIERLLAKDFLSGKNGIEDIFEGSTKKEIFPC